MIIIFVLMYFLALAILAVALRAYLRIEIPIWAEKDFIFSSPKLGRIKARRRAGKIVGFFDNLVGKGHHVDETGKIVPDVDSAGNTVINKLAPRGFWWNHFGVRFIGLDDVYTYKIAKEATEDSEGKFIYVEETASSIYYEGTYPITVFLYTQEGLLFRVKLQLKTTTVDAAKALSLPVSWTIPLFAAVVAASRDHFGSRQAKDLISAQNEGGMVKIAVKNSVNKIANSGYVKLIKGLNNTKNGNISLAEVCGQRIDAVNVVDIDFATTEDKATYFKPYVADQEKAATIAKAEGEGEAVKIKSLADKEAATNKALASRIEGGGIAKGYKLRRVALGGDGKTAANVIIAEKLSGMPGLKALGGTPFVNVD